MKTRRTPAASNACDQSALRDSHRPIVSAGGPAPDADEPVTGRGRRGAI